MTHFPHRLHVQLGLVVAGAWVAILGALLLLVGCTSTGAKDPDYGMRLAADVNCLAQLALDGVMVYSAGGVPSAADTTAAILNAASMSQTALDKCGPMLKNLGADMSAIKAKVHAGKS